MDQPLGPVLGWIKFIQSNSIFPIVKVTPTHIAINLIGSREDEWIPRSREGIDFYALPKAPQGADR